MKVNKLCKSSRQFLTGHTYGNISPDAFENGGQTLCKHLFQIATNLVVCFLLFLSLNTGKKKKHSLSSLKVREITFIGE